MTPDQQKKMDEIQRRIRELDTLVHEFREELIQEDRQRQLVAIPPKCGDSIDHLQQIHYRLTECKGHLGSVKYNLKSVGEVIEEIPVGHTWCPGLKQYVDDCGMGCRGARCLRQENSR